jgi:hypothetical protein
VKENSPDNILSSLFFAGRLPPTLSMSSD